MTGLRETNPMTGDREINITKFIVYDDTIIKLC
jgi:hypothetical protein